MKPRVAKLAVQASLILLAVACASGPAWSQGRRRGAPPPPHIGKTGELYDITGYWVSIVTEDWRYRMVTPRKGDYTGITLNPQGRKLADAWDPAKDEAAGLQCKAYGAPDIMRLPGRLHITWQDDLTLRIDVDTGMQTRLLQFGSVQAGGGDWQGLSKASWEVIPEGGYPLFIPPVKNPPGSLKVITTNLRPGYLRKNGVPYSDRTVLTEYFDKVNEPNGDSYLVITTTVEDPVYLAQPFLTASHYEKQADGSGWNPTPCSAT